jgi:hypothetical protein
MANYYHLLVETPRANLSIGMGQLNGISPRVSIAAINEWAICFSAFKAIPVEKQSYLLELWPSKRDI